MHGRSQRLWEDTDGSGGGDEPPVDFDIDGRVHLFAMSANLDQEVPVSAVAPVIAAVTAAARARKTVALGMGAHVIKVGLNPLLIDLMQRRVLTALAMNGAGIIHDLELAMQGQTSEDVAASLGDGSFGMAADTALLVNDAARRAAAVRPIRSSTTAAAISTVGRWPGRHIPPPGKSPS